jgi:glyoxylase-like metal-dependent hydrolase (beta-lactamase superfamily II)
MTHFICMTCGAQHADSGDQPPAACAICQDERQYVGWQGQRWTTLAELQAGHRIEMREEEPNLTGLAAQPGFAIGQRALLVQSPGGNVLWECLSHIDRATIEAVRALGGIQAIATSHPHMNAAMVEWSRAFDAPIYQHADHRPYIMRPDPVIEFWEGETMALWEGMGLVRCGGHYTGSTVLHWPAGAEGRGVLLTGDTIMVVQDRRYVSFMYSYPNLIPLPARTVGQIAAALEPLAFDRVYSAWWGKVVMADGKAAVARSAERYIRAIEG